MVATSPIYDELLRVIALFEQLLVPLTMVWLGLRWFWLARKEPGAAALDAQTARLKKLLESPEAQEKLTDSTLLRLQNELAKATDDQKKKDLADGLENAIQQSAKQFLDARVAAAEKSAHRAFVCGLLLAIPVVWLVVTVYNAPPPPEGMTAVASVLGLQIRQIIPACIAGVLVGLAAWWAGHNLDKRRAGSLHLWRVDVGLASAIAASSLVIYCMYPALFWAHAWLVWAYLFLFVTASVARLLETKP